MFSLFFPCLLFLVGLSPVCLFSDWWRCFPVHCSSLSHLHQFIVQSPVVTVWLKNSLLCMLDYFYSRVLDLVYVPLLFCPLCGFRPSLCICQFHLPSPQYTSGNHYEQLSFLVISAPVALVTLPQPSNWLGTGQGGELEFTLSFILSQICFDSWPRVPHQYFPIPLMFPNNIMIHVRFSAKRRLSPCIRIKPMIVQLSCWQVVLFPSGDYVIYHDLRGRWWRSTSLWGSSDQPPHLLGHVFFLLKRRTRLFIY